MNPLLKMPFEVITKMGYADSISKHAVCANLHNGKIGRCNRDS